MLDDQPGVLESAVIGVPHPDFGETVLGVIVPEKGAAPDTEAMMQAVQQALARFKHPRALVMLDDLPRNTMGKVQKNPAARQLQGHVRRLSLALPRCRQAWATTTSVPQLRQAVARSRGSALSVKKLSTSASDAIRAGAVRANLV